MIYKWKIVLAPYPFDDFSDDKLRPILCLTQPIGPNFHVIGAFISTQIPTDVEASDLLIDPMLPEWAGCGLKSLSLLRLHRLTTFDISLARKTIGTWPETERARVETRLRSLSSL